MKLIIAIISVLAFSTAYAQEVPSYLKDATITVTLKNGKTYSYSANEYFVAKRGQKKSESSSPLGPVASEPAQKASQPVASSQNKNRIRAFGGVGPTGFSSSSNGSSLSVQTKSGAVGGVGYDRMVSDKVSVGGQAISNGTVTIGVGLDF